MLQQILNNLDMTTCFTFCVVLLASYFIWNYYFSVRINIPGPSPWPIIGNLPEMAKARDLGKKLQELQKSYGNLVLLRFGSQPVVACFGYKMVKEALVANGEKTKFRPTWLHLIKKIFPVLTGIFFSNGQAWSEGRKFTIVALKDFGVGKKSVDERINEEVEFLVEKFSKNPKKPFRPRNLFPMASSNVISNIVFGSRFDYDDPEFNTLLSHIVFFFQTISFAAPENFFPFLENFKISDKNTKAVAGINVVRNYIRSRIEKQRDSFDPKNIRNFLDLYIQQEGKSDSKITEDFLFQAIVDLYNAGTDTTALSLEWCMLYMLNYPDVQDKCREEVMKVIGDGRFPTAKDKESLPYVMATIREVLRIATITSLATPHAVFEDIFIDGNLVPKGTILFCHLRSVLHDPTEWEHPEEFRPARFLDDKGHNIKPEAFVPFSMGPRTCIGQQLAINEIFLFFTSFLQRFKFSKGNPSDVLTTDGEQTGITRQPMPFEMCFEPL